MQHFLTKYGGENDRLDLEITPEALDVLVAYDWPGNVRELENVIERAVVLSSGPRIGNELIPDHVRATEPLQMPRIVVPPEGISLKEVIGASERQLIESALHEAGGVQKRAAELLRIKPTTLNEMIKRYGIQQGQRRKGNKRKGQSPSPVKSDTKSTETASSPLVVDTSRDN